MNRLLPLLLSLLLLTPVALRAEEPDPPPPDAEESADPLPEPDGEADPSTSSPTVTWPSGPIEAGSGITITLALNPDAVAQTLRVVCSAAVQFSNLWYAAGQDLAPALQIGQDTAALGLNAGNGLVLVPGTYEFSAQVEAADGTNSPWVSLLVSVTPEVAGSARALSPLTQGESSQTIEVRGEDAGLAVSADFGADVAVLNLAQIATNRLAVTLSVNARAAAGWRGFTLQLPSSASAGQIRVTEPFTAQPSVGAAPHRNAAMMDGALLASGAWRQQATDLATRGRLLDLAATRTYRGDAAYNGPLGRNWFGIFFERAQLLGNAVVWHTGDGWVHSFSDAGGGLYLPPAGVYAVVRIDAEGVLSLRERNGLTRTFAPGGRLRRISDRHGNRLAFSYDSNGRLATARNDRNDLWEFAWHADGRLASITDTAWQPPRVVNYDYDSDGNLASVALPETERFNTAHGNRATFQYRYDLPGRLTGVVWPREFDAGPSAVAALQLAYDASGRIESIDRGGDVSTLGWGSGFVDAIDARGVRVRQTLDASGHASAITRFNGLWEFQSGAPAMVSQPLRAGEAVQSWTTGFEYTTGHEPLRTTLPSGRQEVRRYPAPVQKTTGVVTSVTGRQVFVDGAGWQTNQWRNHFLRTGNSAAEYAWFLVRANSSNVLEVWTAPPAAIAGANYVVFKDNSDPLAAGNVLRVTQRSAAGAEVYEAFSYEPAFQLTKSRRDADGNIWRWRFDHEGDNATGSGNVAEELSPAITVPAPTGSFTYRIRTRYRHNRHGQVTRVTDPEGTHTQTSYYASGANKGRKYRQVIDPDGLGITRQFDWDAAGNLASEWSPNAFEPGADAERFRTDYSHNAQGLLVATVGPSLRPTGSDRADTRYFHDANGNVTHTLFEYVTDDGTEPEAPENPHDPASYAKSANAMAATWIETTREFDLRNRQTALTQDAIAGEVVHRVRREFSFDASGNALDATSPLGFITRTTFDERQLLLAKTESLGTSEQGATTFSHSADGDLATTTDPLNRAQSQLYDAFGRVARVTDAAGHYRTFTYSNAGLLLNQTAFSSADTQLGHAEWGWDEANRHITTRIQAKNATGQDIGSGWLVESFTRDRTGRVVIRTTPGGGATTFVYDAAGRLLETTDAEGNSATVAHDAAGNVLVVTHTDRNTFDNSTASGDWSAQYDPSGRRTRVRGVRFAQFPESEITMAYDGLSRVTRVQHGASRIRAEYDLRGREVLRVREDTESGNSFSSRVETDDDDRSASIAPTPPEPALPQISGLQYDGRGRLVSITRPDLSVRTNTWNAASEIESFTLEDGTQVAQQFDARGLPTVREITPANSALGTITETLQWDGLGRLVQGERQGLGLRVVTSWAFGTTGPAESITQQVYRGETLIDERTIADAANATGQPATLGFSDATTVGVTHDLLGRVRQLGGAAVDYTGPTNRVRLALPGEITLSRGLEQGVSPLAATLRLEGADATLLAHDLAWDASGRLAADTRRHESGSTRARQHDGLGLLKSVNYSNESLRRVFSHDYFGNLLSIVETNTAEDLVLARAFATDETGRNQYTQADGVLLAWDSASRVVHDGASFVGWDHRGLPVIAAPDSEMQSPTLRTACDVLGRPVFIERPAAGTARLLVYGPDGDDVREEHLLVADAVVQSLRNVNLQARVVMQRVGADWFSRVHDEQGSLIAVSNADGRRTMLVDYLEDGCPLVTPVVLDLRANDITGLELQSSGVLRVSASVTIPPGLPGLELESWYEASGGPVRATATITATGADWLEVLDPTQAMHDALASGARAVVLALKFAPGNWSFDSETGLSRLNADNAAFTSALVGGFVTPSIDEPGWLEIVAVDPNGTWLEARGNATLLPQGRWRAVPSAIGAGLQGECLYRGLRLVGGLGHAGHPHARMLWHFGVHAAWLPLLMRTPAENGDLASPFKAITFDACAPEHVVPAVPSPQPAGAARR